MTDAIRTSIKTLTQPTPFPFLPSLQSYSSVVNLGYSNKKGENMLARSYFAATILAILAGIFVAAALGNALLGLAVFFALLSLLIALTGVGEMIVGHLRDR